MARLFELDINISSVSRVTALKAVAFNKLGERLGSDLFDSNGFAAIDFRTGKGLRGGRNGRSRIEVEVRDLNGHNVNYEKNSTLFTLDPEVQTRKVRIQRNEL
ncbi:MAG: hypothetical protein ACO3GW_02600, partial [Vulcanococcus sp.]